MLVMETTNSPSAATSTVIVVATFEPAGHFNEAGDFIEADFDAKVLAAMTFTPEQEARSARARKALGWS